MNRQISRQVLECGDGVREVTALALTLKVPQVAADTATSTQSGDSEDSVAAVQDARAPTRFIVPVRYHKIVEAFHEPQGRASSPLRADDCNDAFFQGKGRRARSDAPYLGQPVHGPDARPFLEVAT